MGHCHTRETVTARCAAKLREPRSEAAPAQRQRSSNGCKATALSPSTNLLRGILEAFAACAAHLLSLSLVTPRIMACRWVPWMTIPAVRPELHVHVANKAPWFTITDDLPQFAAGLV